MIIKKANIIKEKTYKFSLDIIGLYQDMIKMKVKRSVAGAQLAPACSLNPYSSHRPDPFKRSVHVHTFSLQYYTVLWYKSRYNIMNIFCNA